MDEVTGSAAIMKNHKGFTLVEMIVVLVVLGIMAVLTTGIILNPFNAFQDQSRRAMLVAEADAALTRMVRELRHALPNSVRVSPDKKYIEFIPTKDGGRYRAAYGDNVSDDILDFDNTDHSFDVVGGLQTGTAQAGDFVVVYNTTATGSITNAYTGDNRASIQNASPTSITLSSPGKQFPYPSLDAQRFDVVPDSGPVTFYCYSTHLRRYTNYGFSAAQPTGFMNEGNLLAEHVSTCQFDYIPGDNVRTGVVTLRLGLTDEGESVVLLYQAHVTNAP